MSKSFSALVKCATCAALACGGDEEHTVNGISRGDVAGPRCEGTEVEIDPSSVTALGFSAQAVLGLVVGQHTAPLAWLDSEVEYGPEDGRSELTLTITAAGAPLLVDRELAAGSDGAASFTPDLGAPSPCRDSLRIAATLAITTSSGALDEVVDGIFEAYEGDFAHGRLGIDLAALRGSFSAAPAIPENSVLTASTLGLELGFTEFGASGAFTLGSVFESPGTVGMGTSGEIAHFPADSYCGPTAASVGAAQTVRGLSMARALESLNAAGSTTVRYLSAEASELDMDFSSAAERACANFETSVYGNWPPGLMTLEFPGAVQLSSLDGLIAGGTPVAIRTTNRSDSGMILTTAGLEVQTSTDAASAAALPAQLGIRDTVDASEFDGVTVEFRNSVWSPADLPSGSLEVDGVDIADCVKNPPPRDPNAMMISPCPGIHRTTVWSARWGDAED